MVTSHVLYSSMSMSNPPPPCPPYDMTVHSNTPPTYPAPHNMTDFSEGGPFWLILGMLEIEIDVILDYKDIEIHISHMCRTSLWHEIM